MEMFSGSQDKACALACSEGAVRTQRCTSSTLARLARDLFVALDFESAAFSTGDLVELGLVVHGKKRSSLTWPCRLCQTSSPNPQERPPTLTAFLLQLSSPLRRHWHTRTCVLLGNSHPRCSRPRPLPIFLSLPSLPTPFWPLQTTFSCCLVCVFSLSLFSSPTPRLTDRLGHGVFSFIQADIRGNIAVRVVLLAGGVQSHLWSGFACSCP